jgi:hypothetical protein
MVREPVVRFVGMGPLPSAGSASEEELKEREHLLALIERPLSDDEARELIKTFGPDDCYGLAWTVLHLIETAPGWPIVECLDDMSNEWWARLRMRAVRGGKLER